MGRLVLTTRLELQRRAGRSITLPCTKSSNEDVTLTHKRSNAMKRMLQLLAVSLFVSTTAAWAQQDPFVGTWKQNLAKSSYDPGPPPARGNMHKIEAVPNGLKVTTTGVNAQGQPSGSEWTAYYDGKDHPM